jgi:hypothetical protein
METNEFILNYDSFLEEIGELVRPELRIVIDQLKNIDAHYFATPETYLMTENQAKIHVWRMFLKRARHDFPDSFPKD